MVLRRACWIENMDTRTALKGELLAHISDFNAATEAAAAPSPLIGELIERLVPLSPIPDPTAHLPAVTGSWTSLFAKFGVGHSKGKSHKEDSTLALQTFKAFPDIPVHVIEMVQEIGSSPLFYNNVVLFETLGGTPGLVIIHGTWMADEDERRRFRVVFHGAEVRPRDGRSSSELRTALGLEPDAPLKRDFKPAKLYSDVVYLDEAIRINYGGMGGVYVLARREGPLLSPSPA